MVTAGDYKKLPPEIEEVLSHLPETGPDRAAAFDQAYYRYGWRIFGKKSGLLRDYWRARMDLLNLLIFLRLRKRGASFGELSRFLVEPGFINHHEWLSRFEESQPELGSLLEYTPYRELLPGGEKNLTELSALERAIDDYLLSIAKAAKMVPLGIEPIIGYLLAKEREILNLRLVFTGKLNKLPEETVRRRLRDVYF
jgi:V/A-type H+-transporting ATPase subunit C